MSNYYPVTLPPYLHCYKSQNIKYNGWLIQIVYFFFLISDLRWRPTSLQTVKQSFFLSLYSTNLHTKKTAYIRYLVHTLSLFLSQIKAISPFIFLLILLNCSSLSLSLSLLQPQGFYFLSFFVFSFAFFFFVLLFSKFILLINLFRNMLFFILLS